MLFRSSVFEDGVIRLVIEKTPNNASDNFNNPGGTALSVRFETGKSYIFTSQNENGTNFIAEEGTYLPCQSKFLFIDEEGVKSYLQAEASSAWSKVADVPITETMFLEHGVDILPNDFTGLLSQATLCYFTDNPSIVMEIENYTLEVKEVVTSKPKVIIQRESFPIAQNRYVDVIEVVTSEVGGKIRIAISTDNGLSYKTFSQETSSFVPINIENTEKFLLNGIRTSELVNLDYAMLNIIAPRCA